MNEINWVSQEQRKNLWKEAKEKLKSKKIGSIHSLNNLSFLKLTEFRVVVYDQTQKLGEGRFGCAYFCETQAKDSYVLKIFNNNELINKKEIEIANDLGESDLSSIVKIENNQAAVLLKYLGDPLDYYLKDKKLSEDEQFTLAFKILFKIQQLHSGALSKKSIAYAHLDLRPKNITIDTNNDVHLIDFGFAKKLQGQIQLPKGSAQYLSIDCINLDYQSADVFSILRVLFISKIYKQYDRYHSSNLKEVTRNLTDQFIFSDEIIEKYPKLKALLDTSSGLSKKLSIDEIIDKVKQSRADEKIKISDERTEKMLDKKEKSPLMPLYQRQYQYNQDAVWQKPKKASYFIDA